MNKTLESHDPILQAAREMRRNQTPAENALWAALRGRQFSGLRFYRQRVIGPFITDFYCAAARLTIEVDGDIHDYQASYDMERTKQLEEFGFHAIRFRNETVLNDIKSVLDQIKNAAFERISDLNPYHQREHKDAAGSPETRRRYSPLPMNSGEGAGG